MGEFNQAGKAFPADTKTRILDAAETLFVSGGFEALSMRQITALAQVNLAAVNYHFGGKDALIHTVLARHLDVLNDQRGEMLTQLETTQGASLTCEHVMVAMFLPALRISRSEAPHADRFLQFLGRAYTDPSPVVRAFLETHYVDTLARFFRAFQKTLPALTVDDLGFRLHFAMGALAGVLAGGSTQRLLNEFTQGQAQDETFLLTRLITLMAAALKVPLPAQGDTSLLSDMAALF